jgi:arsenical pump membrane protein
MPTITSEKPDISATITSPRDRLPAVLWTAAVILAAAAACLRPDALLPAARATLGPFATLAAIIAASVLAGRLGLFRTLAKLLIPGRAPRALAAASVLAFTAVLSGLVNLDVAVVVAMPAALEAARRHALPAGRLAVAVAITANAASFLLPTSNVTSLLLLGRAPLPALAYLRGSWLAWLLVVAVTVGPRSGWAARAAHPDSGPARVPAARPSLRAALDLVPLFAAASAVRAILAAGVALRGGLAAQLAAGSALACAANNLPAAAALRPAGTAALWAAILATAIGPGLLLTGSVATLICRRIARDAGAALRAWQFTAIGSVLVPAQLAAAVIGLHLTGALR